MSDPIENGPDGLLHVANFLDSGETVDLLRTIDAGEWAPIGNYEAARRVQQYGARYDHRTAGVHRGQAEPFPAWCAAVGGRILDRGYMAKMPEQVIINEYLPGQGIAPHIDNPDDFGDPVISISLGSPVMMDFSRPGEKHSVWLEGGSMVVMGGESRLEWKHGIAKRHSDMVNGERIARQRRVSLTFRTLL